MRALPVDVRGAFGRQVLDAQYGDTPASAKPLKGFGGTVDTVTVCSTAGSRLERRVLMAKGGSKPTQVDRVSETTVRPNDSVFAALDLPAADERLAKAELARAIQRLIAKLGLTQTQAAAVLGGAQSDISNLAHGRLAGYSMERLYRFLNALGQDVRIVVRPKPRTRHEGTVRALIHETA